MRYQAARYPRYGRLLSRHAQGHQDYYLHQGRIIPKWSRRALAFADEITALFNFGDLAWKRPVRVATTAPITIPATGLIAVDGVTPADGDYVLIKDQTIAGELPFNGIWVARAGLWERRQDADADDDLHGAVVFAIEGTLNHHQAWVQATPHPTIGQSPINWRQYTGGGAGAHLQYRATPTADGQMSFADKEKLDAFAVHRTEVEGVSTADINYQTLISLTFATLGFGHVMTHFDVPVGSDFAGVNVSFRVLADGALVLDEWTVTIPTSNMQAMSSLDWPYSVGEFVPPAAGPHTLAVQWKVSHGNAWVDPSPKGPAKLAVVEYPF